MPDEPTQPIVNAPQEGNSAEVETPVSDIPADLQGKSAQELAQMFMEQKRMYGAQSNEVGQLRESLRVLSEKVESSQQPVSREPVDFYEDPLAAVNQAIDAKMAPVNAMLQQQREAQTVQQLHASFPGWQDTAKDKAFQNWVAESQNRLNLWRAGNAGDYGSCAELFSTWQQLSEVKGQVQQAERKAVDRERKLRAAKTERGSAGLDPRKKHRASDLRALKQNNPERYTQLGPDIQRAYREGRVIRD